MRAAVKNASDPEQVERAKESVANRADRLDDGVADWLKTPAGREYLLELLDFCGAKTVSYNGTEHGTIFREGMRNVALRLEADIERVCPELMDAARVEARQRGRNDA